MKKEIDPKVLIAVIGTVLFALLATAWAVFRPGLNSTTPTNYTQG